MEEIVSHKQVRLFKWNVKSVDHDHEHHIPQAQVLFLIRSRFVSDPATSNVRFSYPIAYNFAFNPKCLSSSTNSVQTMAYEAVLSTNQFHDLRNIVGLANTISGYVVKNHSFGLDKFSNPNAPRVVIVVEVNKTWLLKGFQDYGIGEIEGDQSDVAIIDEETMLLMLTNLLRVPVFSVLEPSNMSEPLGLTQIPGLNLFKLCDVGAFAGDEGTCAICLEEFSMDSCRKMPCSHVFHGHCIAQWLWRKRSCPVCRSQLVN
ncbi:hypothetical protein PTKIN_Ptkin19aG0025200 [Pterospermum kingtungense]